MLLVLPIQSNQPIINIIMRININKFWFSRNLKRLDALLQKSFAPIKFRLVDKSHLHFEATDSHFDLYIVSEDFENVPRFQRYFWSCLLIVTRQPQATAGHFQIRGPHGRNPRCVDCGADPGRAPKGDFGARVGALLEGASIQ